MKTIIHTAESRGIANHGWLNSRHTFSFAGYHNPDRMNFGVLRVLNDDIVKGGTGFGAHPHRNMEIVSIPISGALEHLDSTGRHKIIKSGEVQIMSAGRGITHSEYNASKEEDVNFLQIWAFPEKPDIEPRYEQKEYNLEVSKNNWVSVVSPDENDGALWINQNAYFSMGEFEKEKSFDYLLKDTQHGVYLFVINGSIKVNDHVLKNRDAIGLYDFSEEKINLRTLENSRLLLMEVPMVLQE